MGESEGPLKDETLVREALAFVRAYEGPDRRQFLNLLEEATRHEDMARKKKLVEEIRAEVARLRLEGGE